MSSRTLFAIAFLLCALVQVSQQRSEELPQAVIDLMASRAMRYHHFLWHNLRENWSYLPATTQHELRKYGWGVDRPALTLTSNGTEVALEDNGSGEEFLWMHRLMIEQVNEIVADTDYERVTGWKNCPYPGDPKWGVPENYTTASDFLTEFVNSRKTDEFFWTRIQPIDEKLHDADYLRSVSLGKLGSNVEFTVHRDMHLRFSDPGTVGLRAPTRNPTPDIDEKWDDPAYRWLGDTYASHVNPTFWKIHGWVDDHIEAWRKANGLDEVEWTYTWTGGPSQTLEDLFVAGSVDTSGTPDGDEDSDYVHPMHENMEQAVKILLKEDMRNPLKNPFFNEVPVSIRELIKSK